MTTFAGLDETAMERLGRELGKRLFPGAFIALWGYLGAGKTTLTKAIALEAGIDDIQSPTFTIVREHRTAKGMDLLHFDAYRLEDEDELYAIGFNDYIARNGVIIMEWCENVPGALPGERLDIKIEGSGDQPRSVTMTAHGQDHAKLLEGIPEIV